MGLGKFLDAWGTLFMVDCTSYRCLADGSGICRDHCRQLASDPRNYLCYGAAMGRRGTFIRIGRQVPGHVPG